MKKFEYEKKISLEILEELTEVYGDSSPYLSTIKYFTAEFRRGRKRIFDEERLGRPNEVATSEMIEKIHDIIK